MINRNPRLAQLKGSYLFPEINRRKRDYLLKNPQADLISLGIGDTTEPIPKIVSEQLSHYADKLSSPAGYSGYGPEQGNQSLRQKIASRIYHHLISPDDIFISDGAKCDIGRLQLLFGPDVSIAVQDPAYPVYVEGSLIQGVKEIAYLPCTPDNHFFPDLNNAPRTDLLYFCSPNNPTGAAANRVQLEQLVQFAKKNRTLIIYDAAYANFIQNDDIPKSIYEINGALETAIEINSFSKLAGFTGIRLSWCVVPEALKYRDGSSIKNDWIRLISTIFNGASNIAQHGGYQVLDEGWEEIKKMASAYMHNATLIKKCLEDLGHRVHGGTDAPYLWIQFKGKNSWDIFQHLLEDYHLVTTPGIGFGNAGHGFLRMTSFGSREKIESAMQRLAGKFYA